MAIGYSLRMCPRHVDSTNPGRSNLVFRSKPTQEADMSNVPYVMGHSKRVSFFARDVSDPVSL